MKKYVLGLITLLLLTGCTNIYDCSNDKLIKDTFDEKPVKSNVHLQGYNLYIPQDMTLIGDLNSNNILYSYGDKYYLYVDLISYYNKKQNKYNINHKTYIYSKEFVHKGLNGYVIVSKSKGGNLVEVMYNYAKIEVVTKDVKRALVNSIIVLENIKYNYKIIDSMIGTNALVYDSELFTLLGPKKDNKDSFLTYEKEYGTYDEEEDEVKDEDVVDINTED